MAKEVLDLNKYIIYTPLYRDNCGGAIVLHKLCSMLREQGLNAMIWPYKKPHVNQVFSIKGIKRHYRWYTKIQPEYFMRSKDTSSPYNLPQASVFDLQGAVVVYPEVIAGNPLRAKKVVRWLLNMPGRLTGRFEYGKDDLFFYYCEHFNDRNINPDQGNHLYVVELMNNIYKKYNNTDRHGACYMVRKGKGRSLDQHDDSAINVDGLNHLEMATIFNRCKHFVSYDSYTMYSRYAAMCGCIPVVIPEPGITKEQWRPEIETRYGIAYGWDDIPWAIKTRGKLLEHLGQIEVLANKSVQKFLEKTQEHFSNT